MPNIENSLNISSVEGNVYVTNEIVAPNIDTTEKEITKDKKFVNNRKEDYVKFWDRRLFLHFDNEENPLTLHKTFIMPSINVYKKINRIRFATDDTLDKRLHKFINYDQTCTMLITGVPGMGKTSVISWIANNYKNNDKIIILAFRDLARASLEKSLLSAICSRFNCNDEDLENKILILDGFDEIKALDIREKLLNDFINDLNDFNNFKCIITSRPGYIDTDYFQNVFELKQFDIEKVSSFYKKITGKVLDKNNEIESYLEVLGIPVILYMAIMSNIDISLKHTKPELYNLIFAEKGGIFERFYNGETEYDKGKQLFRDSTVIKEYLKFLRESAFKIFEKKNCFCLENGEYSIPQLQFDGKSVSILEFPIKHLFERVNNNIEFIHKTIYEYFMAEYIIFEIDRTIKGSTEDFAGMFGELFKRNHLSEEILEFLRYKIVDRDFHIINRTFQLMLQNGMTYYTNKCYKNVIDCEMNIFANMLSILHLWGKDILKLHKCAMDYIQCSKKLILNLNNVFFETEYINNVDFSDADLRNKDLSGVNLNGAYLRGVYLDAAILVGADLRGADLISSHLKKADLTGADLTGAVLIGASLAEAKMQKAHLEEADLRKANLRGVKLENANLRGTKLSYSMWLEKDIPNVLSQLKEAEFTYIVIYNQTVGLKKGREVSREELFAVKA